MRVAFAVGVVRHLFRMLTIAQIEDAQSRTAVLDAGDLADVGVQGVAQVLRPATRKLRDRIEDVSDNGAGVSAQSRLHAAQRKLTMSRSYRESVHSPLRMR